MPVQDRVATQTRPLEGFRVIEVALHGSVASAGAVLADWGADVIKVEQGRRPGVEHAGKRSLGLDITRTEGREVLYGLVARSDVFLTSFAPPARQRFGIDLAEIREANPRIVYSGGGAVETHGDTESGTHLAVGIAAALLRRERTGESSVVDALAPAVPGLFRTSDGRYLALDVSMPGTFWSEICRHIDRPDLADDPRFRTVEQFAGHAGEALGLLREALATRTLAEWTERFAPLTGAWAPVQDPTPAETAAQTERILMDLGLDWDRIIALKASGAIT